VILISNDTDFNKMKKAGIIEVRSISEAVRRMRPPVYESVATDVEDDRLCVKAAEKS